MIISKSRWYRYFYTKRGKKFIFPAIIALMISACLGYYLPIFWHKVFAHYDRPDEYRFYLFSLLGIFTGVFFNRMTYSLLINKYVQYLLEDVRTRVYTKWLSQVEIRRGGKRQGGEFFPLGEVLSRVINDAEAIRELVTSGAFGIIIDLFFIISGLLSFLTIHVEAGSVLIVSQVTVCLCLLWGSRYLAKVFYQVRKSSGEMARVVANVTGGLREIHYTKHYHYGSKKCRSYFETFLSNQLKANVFDASFYSLADSLFPIFLLILVATLPMTDLKVAATIAVMIDLIQRSIGPIKDVTGKISSVQRAIAGMRRIEEFINVIDSGEKTNEGELGNMEHPQLIRANIKKFSYRQENSQRQLFELNNIEFSAKSGEVVGMVGLSGSGKSTVLRILSGHNIPEEGEIVIENKQGQVIAKFPAKNPENYRQYVGLVSQDSHVFSETLNFNISMSVEVSPELEEFWKMLLKELPYLSIWGVSLTDKVHAPSLSLGQKQLISAIRALYLKKSIILLDEIASGLDSELELSLRKLTKMIQNNSITFVVAHRLETIINADRIIVLEGGQLISEGSHKQLLSREPVYQKFIEHMQS